MKRNKNRKRYDADMAALETTLRAHRAAFLRALAASDSAAMARWSEGQGLLTRPQRICTEAFAQGGESFEQIADRTGYLLSDIEAHIIAAVKALVPEDAVGNQHVEPTELAIEVAASKVAVEPTAEVVIESATVLEEPLEQLDSQSVEPPVKQPDNQLVEPLEEPPRMSRRAARQTLEMEQEDDENTPSKHRWLKIMGAAVGLVAALCMVVAIISLLTRNELVPHIDEPPADIPAEVVENGDTYTDHETATDAYADDGYNDVATDAINGVDSTTATAGSGADATAKTAGSASDTATDAPSSGRRAELTAISKEADGQPTSKPQIGRREYNAYLAAAAMALPADAHGEVTITFKVNAYGRPSQIRVTSTFSREANHEAIRLLANGPEWTESQRLVSITIRFN